MTRRILPAPVAFAAVAAPKGCPAAPESHIVSCLVHRTNRPQTPESFLAKAQKTEGCWQCRLCRREVTGRDESGRDETEEVCRRYNQPVWDSTDAEHCEFFIPKGTTNG